ncbi:MAG: protein-L-isoaspartate(D-aspartate) O-methyltransferase [Anaerolineales bacterium]|nr:protein-L-isoaspartate(D-aspartate) O-methyltransferase [Anaerolineales bacterium]MBS3752143.1 protein-L-isoaspartate(D-aspartate) O-methyltransferase [Anaerolineales bacterium]
MDYQKARERMVERQIARRGIDSPRVLEAFRSVPRHLFVPQHKREFAYSDGPLPIGRGQTISQPYIVAYMTEALELQGEERVLEIGTGSGYQAAILGELAAEVYTVERHQDLAKTASQRLQDMDYENIHVIQGDGTEGLPEHAPFQGVIVTAAAPEVPRPLLDQLDEGGRLIMPVGSRGGQVLKLYQRREGDFSVKALSPVAFVPLIGEHGHSAP